MARYIAFSPSAHHSSFTSNTPCNRIERMPSNTWVGGRASATGWSQSGKHRHGVIDARERQQDEGKRPGKLLGAEPVAQDHAGGEKSERPTRQHEQREEGHKRKPEIEQVEAEEEIGCDSDGDHADGKAQHAPHT